MSATGLTVHQGGESRALASANDMRAQVNLIQEVMKAVMKADTHYGVIPGCKKPSLYKPGAEVLAATFRIAVSYQIEDLSSDDRVRYRVAAIGTHQMTGVVLGEGMGECSSGEEKYKWRGAICDEEFDLTPENRRRIKFSKWNNRVEKKKQVRTEPSDQANTILKVACKRAQVAMTLNVTAASDIFTQDIEDLPEELRPEEQTQEPARPAITPYPADKFASLLPAWSKLVVDGAKTPAAILATVKTKHTLTPEQEQQIVALAKPTAPAAPPADDEWGAAYDKREIENREKRDATA